MVYVYLLVSTWCVTIGRCELLQYSLYPKLGYCFLWAPISAEELNLCHEKGHMDYICVYGCYHNMYVHKTKKQNVESSSPQSMMEPCVIIERTNINIVYYVFLIS